MRILVWHVHGSWTTSLVQGGHEYLLPVSPGRDGDGLGRARTWDWPSSAREVPLERLAAAEPDVVLLQRERDLQLCRDYLGREPGRDLPALWVEHNTPRGDVAAMRHPLADRSDIPVVHVTHFNRLYWDCGRAPTRVLEHGVVDPGYRYEGSLPRAAVAINEPLRRGRVTGTDLLEPLSRTTPIDLFGMQVRDAGPALGVPAHRLTAYDDLPQHRLHQELARRAVYLHLSRWTSLGLSLLEAMHLGMPVVALAATEVVEAVPPDAGVVSTRLDVVERGLRRFTHDGEAARQAGLAARRAALARYGLRRFLDDLDLLVKEVTA